MILVDTSVWVDHLRAGDAALGERLNHSQVLMHPFVLGEIACGNLRSRDEVLGLLKALPQAIVASHEEVLFFIERNALMGRGIGYVNASISSGRPDRPAMPDFEVRCSTSVLH